MSMATSPYCFSSSSDVVRAGSGRSWASQKRGPDVVGLLHDDRPSGLVAPDRHREAEGEQQPHEGEQRALHDADRFDLGVGPGADASTDDDPDRGEGAHHRVRARRRATRDRGGTSSPDGDDQLGTLAHGQRGGDDDVCIGRAHDVVSSVVVRHGTEHVADRTEPGPDACRSSSPPSTAPRGGRSRRSTRRAPVPYLLKRARRLDCPSAKASTAEPDPPGGREPLRCSRGETENQNLNKLMPDFDKHPSNGTWRKTLVLARRCRTPSRARRRPGCTRTGRTARFARRGKMGDVALEVPLRRARRRRLGQRRDRLRGLSIPRTA